MLGISTNILVDFWGNWEICSNDALFLKDSLNKKLFWRHYIFIQTRPRNFEDDVYLSSNLLWLDISEKNTLHGLGTKTGSNPWGLHPPKS